MVNKVKYIVFPTTIKLKTIELKVDAMLDTGASKNPPSDQTESP